MRLAPVAGAILLAVLLTPARAGATPAQKLAEARALFKTGDYPSVIATVYPLLFPDPALATRSEITEAYLMLGVSYFETDHLDESESWFEEALLLDPSVDLDPAIYSPKVVSFFRKKREALAAKIVEARKAAELAAYKAALANLRQVNVERHPYYINFLPFGAGQFQNGASAKGKFFAITEGVLGGTSLVAFGALALKYGFPTHRIPNDPGDISLSVNLQRTHVGAGIAFTALYIWGVVDALRNYHPTIVHTTQVDPRYLPPDLRRPGGRTHLDLRPVVGPDRAGVIVHWEF